MSAFQAYGGAYEIDGRPFTWRCYATARVYEVRVADQLPLPRARHGTKWILRAGRNGELEARWLVDAATIDFNHILLQVEASEPRAGARQDSAHPAHA